MRAAVRSLKHPSLAGRLTNIVGKSVELIGYALPSFASKGDRSRDLERARGRAQGRPPDASFIVLGALAASSPSARDGIGRRRRDVRAGGASGRTAGVDRHHAPFDRGHPRRTWGSASWMRRGRKSATLKRARRRPAVRVYIPQRKADVQTGASQRRFISSSRTVTVTEQPAISSDVTKLPTRDRATTLPANSNSLRTASYIR